MHCEVVNGGDRSPISGSAIITARYVRSRRSLGRIGVTFKAHFDTCYTYIHTKYVTYYIIRRLMTNTLSEMTSGSAYVLDSTCSSILDCALLCTYLIRCSNRCAKLSSLVQYNKIKLSSSE